jgi:hypothetical protein
MDCFRPKTKEELFNLRHASLRNVVERIFGVLKRRFRILLLAPEYSFEIQARIPAALAALHNFIQVNSLDRTDDGVDDDDNPGLYAVDFPGVLGVPDENGVMHALRDKIAQEMWDDYQRCIRERYGENEAVDSDTDSGSE